MKKYEIMQRLRNYKNEQLATLYEDVIPEAIKLLEEQDEFINNLINTTRAVQSHNEYIDSLRGGTKTV